MEQMEDAEREEPSCWLKMGGRGVPGGLCVAFHCYSFGGSRGPKLNLADELLWS